MAEQQQTIFIDVQFNANDVAKKLSEVTMQVSDLKNEQKELTAEIKAGNDADGQKAKQLVEVSARIKQLTAEQKALTGQLETTIKANDELGTSFREMDAQCRALENQYKSLTKAQRESAEGQALKKALIEQKKALADFDSELGNNQRKVGSYKEQIIAAFKQMGGGMNAVINPIKNVTGGLNVMSQTPIIAIIGAIVTVIMKLSEKFKQNQAAMESLTKVFGLFEGVGVVVSKMIDGLAKGVGWLADKMFAFADKLGLVSDEMKESQRIALESLEMQKKEREMAVQNAEATRDIAELRAKAADKEKYTAEERAKFLEEALNKEEEIAKRERDLAKQAYELQKAKNAQTASSEEDKKRKSELYVAMIQAETNYNNQKRKLQKELSAARKEDMAEVQEQMRVRAEAAKKAAEAKQKELEIYQAQLDEMARRRRTDRENTIYDLEQKRDKELQIAKLTADERLEIEDYYAAEIAKRRQEWADADAKAEAEAIAKKEEARAAALAQFGLTPEKSAEDLELEALQQAYEQKLLTDEEYEWAKTEITSKYADERAQIQQAEVDKATKLQEQSLKKIGQSASQAMSALSDMFGAFAEESEEAAAAQKAFGMMNIIVNQATAIAEGAKGIAAAMASGAGVPFPGNIAAIATGVAAATSIIASVTSTIVQAKQLFSKANTQKFAQGGIVGGTSYTGDNVPVMANSREMFITLEQQKHLMDLLNTPASAGGYDMMRAAMSDALQNMPAPVMVYSEFEQFGKKVATIKEIVNI